MGEPRDRAAFGVGDLIEVLDRLDLCSGRHDQAVTIGPSTKEIRHDRSAYAAPAGYYNSYYTGRSDDVRIGRNSLQRLAPQAGFEPATLRLTAGCSAVELLRNIV